MRRLFRRMAMGVFLLAAAPSLTLLSGQAATAADFQNPMIQGYRLDWCRQWASNCGKPAADAFCAAQGFSHATNFTKADNIGAQSPTRVISSGQICNQAPCDGFGFIRCAAQPQPVSKTFPKPALGGFRVDWCREWANNCGKPAADAFCKAKGYNQATNFTKASDIGAQSPTRVISSGQICNQGFCDGFGSVTCN